MEKPEFRWELDEQQHDEEFDDMFRVVLNWAMLLHYIEDRKSQNQRRCFVLQVFLVNVYNFFDISYILDYEVI